jgi:uncharacterized repeat protein (TIGR01451 family)
VSIEDSGTLVNTANATAMYAFTEQLVSDDDSASVTIGEPSPVIALSKTANVAAAVTGDNITYTYAVSNNGNVPLTNISVTDDMIEAVALVSGDANGNEILDVGETWSYSANYTVSIEDSGTLVNTANATGMYAFTEQLVSDDDSASVTIGEPSPVIAINKTANVAAAVTGDTITYTYEVSNAGNVPLTNISVTDDMIEAVALVSGDANGNEILDVGETWIFTATYTVSVEDTGTLVNTATASGIYEVTEHFVSVSNIDSASVTISEPSPAVAISKTADVAEAVPGDTITYTYEVSNAGNVPLTNISVTDDMIETVALVSGDANGNEILDVGETWIFTATYTVNIEDTGTLVNTATASGTYALTEQTVTAEDTASVTINIT